MQARGFLLAVVCPSAQLLRDQVCFRLFFLLVCDLLQHNILPRFCSFLQLPSAVIHRFASHPDRALGIFVVILNYNDLPGHLHAKTLSSSRRPHPLPILLLGRRAPDCLHLRLARPATVEHRRSRLACPLAAWLPSGALSFP
jgi:hypothetical protein